jgi:hypothetical protein
MSAGIAGVLGAVTGAALLVVPHKLLEGSSPLRRLLFETNLGEPFNHRFVIERRLYRQHRIFGSTVVAGGLALAALATYLVLNPKALNLYLLLGKSSFRVVQFLAATIALLLVVVGVCLVVRPSLLKGIEAAANRWVEPLPGRRTPTVAAAVLRAPRVAGAMLLLVSTYGLSLL